MFDSRNFFSNLNNFSKKKCPLWTFKCPFKKLSLAAELEPRIALAATWTEDCISGNLCPNAVIGDHDSIAGNLLWQLQLQLFTSFALTQSRMLPQTGTFSTSKKLHFPFYVQSPVAQMFNSALKKLRSTNFHPRKPLYTSRDISGNVSYLLHLSPIRFFLFRRKEFLPGTLAQINDLNFVFL